MKSESGSLDVNSPVWTHTAHVSFAQWFMFGPFPPEKPAGSRAGFDCALVLCSDSVSYGHEQDISGLCFIELTVVGFHTEKIKQK